METEITLTKQTGLSLVVFGFCIMLSPVRAQSQNEERSSNSQPVAEAIKKEGKTPDEVRISAIMEGVAVATHVQSGDQVKRGQVLLTLDTREHKIRLRIAEARVDVAKGEEMVRHAELDAVQAKLEESKSSGSKPSALKAAEFAVLAAKGKHQKAQASVAAAQMEAELHHLFLSRCQMEAPVSGKVKRVTTRMGEFVSKKQVVVVIERDRR